MVKILSQRCFCVLPIQPEKMPATTIALRFARLHPQGSAIRTLASAAARQPPAAAAVEQLDALDVAALLEQLDRMAPKTKVRLTQGPSRAFHAGYLWAKDDRLGVWKIVKP